MTYELPPDLIAQKPAEPRDSARLLAAARTDGTVSHRVFRDLPDYLEPGDCLVLNDTRVVPARLFGVKSDTGQKVELLLLQMERDAVYRCLGQPGKRLKPGAQLSFNHGSVRGEVLSSEGGTRLVRFEGENLDGMLHQLGQVPLPPYIRRPVETADAGWYQTVYARVPGAVAAPTAGLHFTPELLKKIRSKGVVTCFVTLHVGWGTFKPVGEEEMKAGRLHPEWFTIPAETAQAVQAAKKGNKRVVAVGTTTLRALETAAAEDGTVRAMEGTTEIFIQSPFRFRAADAMVTNFHLPGTSLLLLVSAFAGDDLVQKAYAEAVRERYRFFSYGDAMLIV